MRTMKQWKANLDENWGFLIIMGNETFGDIAKVEQIMRETIILAIIYLIVFCSHGVHYVRNNFIQDL